MHGEAGCAEQGLVHLQCARDRAGEMITRQVWLTLVALEYKLVK